MANLRGLALQMRRAPGASRPERRPPAADARAYDSSAQREAALQPFLHRYNWHRPHFALNHQPPMSRIPAMNNLLELNT